MTGGGEGDEGREGRKGEGEKGYMWEGVEEGRGKS